VSTPCAVIALILKLLTEAYDDRMDYVPFLQEFASTTKVDGAAFTGVNFLLGFLVVFRTSQAYGRFWDGCSAMHAMMAEWFDASSSLFAFCKNSPANVDTVVVFQHTLVRLFSILSATALKDLSESPAEQKSQKNQKEQDSSKREFELELIDAEGLDLDSLKAINESECKVELIFQWIQQLIVEANERMIFNVQAPILSRVFNELANGMVRYHDCLKIASVPFPFPYVQTLELLLVMHWMVTPMVMCLWIDSRLWVFATTFLQIFFFWSLNFIASELENPFGEDDNDLPVMENQCLMNQRLLLLMRPNTMRTPHLSSETSLCEDSAGKGMGQTVSVGFEGIRGISKLKAKPLYASESNKISLGNLRRSIQYSADIQPARDSRIVFASTLSEHSTKDSPDPMLQGGSLRTSLGNVSAMTEWKSEQDQFPQPPLAATGLLQRFGSNSLAPLGAFAEEARLSEQQEAFNSGLKEMIAMRKDMQDLLKTVSSATLGATLSNQSRKSPSRQSPRSPPPRGEAPFNLQDEASIKKDEPPGVRSAALAPMVQVPVAYEVLDTRRPGVLMPVSCWTNATRC
jgi:putative membrane protein